MMIHSIDASKCFKKKNIHFLLKIRELYTSRIRNNDGFSCFWGHRIPYRLEFPLNFHPRNRNYAYLRKKRWILRSQGKNSALSVKATGKKFLLRRGSERNFQRTLRESEEGKI